MHGGTNPGAPKGSRNARKRGGYSTETKQAVKFLKAVANRLRLRMLIRPYLSKGIV